MGRGTCAPLLLCRIYPRDDVVDDSTGFATTCALNALGGVLAVVLYLSYRRDNAAREAMHGHPDPDAPVDTSELADKVCAVDVLSGCRGALTLRLSFPIGAWVQVYPVRG